MTEKEFLKAFEKHCEIAKSKIPKSRMIEAIEWGRCPFSCWNSPVNSCGIMSMADCPPCPIFHMKSKRYEKASQFYMQQSTPEIRRKMITVVKKVKWR